eukprot:8417973-Alexandrium_andersonii.AAC.1
MSWRRRGLLGAAPCGSVQRPTRHHVAHALSRVRTRAGWHTGGHEHRPRVPCRCPRCGAQARAARR